MNKIVITENDGRYTLEAENLSDFILIGVLECVLADLKSVSRKTSSPEAQTDSASNTEISPPVAEIPAADEQPKQKTTTDEAAATATPDIRTRIGNAVKAIRSLGGQIEDVDLDRMSDEELQSELETLTDQYKRLKARKSK